MPVIKTIYAAVLTMLLPSVLWAEPFGPPDLRSMIRLSDDIVIGQVRAVSGGTPVRVGGAVIPWTALAFGVDKVIKGQYAMGQIGHANLAGTPQGTYYGTTPSGTSALLGLNGLFFLRRSGGTGPDAGGDASGVILFHAGTPILSQAVGTTERQVAQFIATGFTEPVANAARLFNQSLGGQPNVLVTPDSASGELASDANHLVPASETDRADFYYSRLYRYESVLQPTDVVPSMLGLRFAASGSVGKIWVLSYLYQHNALTDRAEFDEFVMNPRYGFPALIHTVGSAIFERFRNERAWRQSDLDSLKMFAHSPIADVRRSAVATLAATNNAAVIPNLILALDDQSAPVRDQALFGLCGFIQEIDEKDCGRLGRRPDRAELLSRLPIARH